MIEAVFVVPFVAGIVAFFLPSKLGRGLLPVVGAVHLLLTVLLWVQNPTPIFAEYFALAPEGLLSLGVISVLFLLIAIYTMSYLEQAQIGADNVFVGSMLLFLATMTMVTLSDHIMIMWIAIEATTLASAPLIYSHRSGASLEATWKYVLVCSVGIALALLGSVFISVAMEVGKVTSAISFSALTAEAKGLDPVWLKAGFVFVLVGYGTKMGLAPMHTWLPDAHSEAPSPASALLSGVLLNCAFLGIFKTNKVMHAAGLADFSGTILIVFGLMSILVAATFILRQSEYKRLLAYSSIENMGIIAFGTGIGGLAAYGAMLCLIHHSLLKSSLFLSSGNILLGYGSQLIEEAKGLANKMPRTFLAFFSGFVGISGFPPFGIFIGELLIIIGAFRTGNYISVSLFLASLCIVFAGFANHALKMSFAETDATIRIKEKIAMTWPQYSLLLTSLVLCFWMPDVLYQTLVNAVSSIGGGLE